MLPLPGGFDGEGLVNSQEAITLSVGLWIAGLRWNGVELLALPGGDLSLTFPADMPAERQRDFEGWLKMPAIGPMIWAAQTLLQREEDRRHGGIGRG